MNLADHHSVVSVSDLFEDRAEAGHDVDRRSEAIYLYGVDYLSTRDCLSYFSDYCPLFVEWINDSSAVVVFADPAGCKRAMVGRGRPLPPTDDTPTEGLDPTDLANLPFLWHQGADFNKDGSLIKLIYRMATVVDVKNVDAPRETRELWKQVGSNKVRYVTRPSERHCNQWSCCYFPLDRPREGDMIQGKRWMEALMRALEDRAAVRSATRTGA